MKTVFQEIGENNKEIKTFRQVNSLEEYIANVSVDILNTEESKEQYLERLALLLNSDEFDIDVIDSKENTLLHYAIIENKPALAKALLQRKDLEKLLEHENIDGMVPLHLTVYHKNWVLAQQLIERGADVNAKVETKESEDYGKSILWCIVYSAVSEPIQELIDKEFDVLKFAQQLIDKGIDVNAKAESSNSLHYGISILWLAIYFQEWKIAQQLIDRGADANATAKSPNSLVYGISILWLAIGYQEWEFAQQLLDRGAEVNAKLKTTDCRDCGMSVLWLAVCYQRWDFAQQLIDKNADVNAKAESQDSLFYGISILWLAVYHQQWSIAQQLIDKKADVNSTAESLNILEYGISILWWVVYYQQWELAQQLIDKGADVNATAKLSYNSEYGTSILWWAVYYQQWEFAQQLIDKGANVNEKAKSPDNSEYGTSILWLAVRFGKWEFVQKLIEKGASADVMAQKGIYCGISILWWVVYHKQWDLAQHLIEGGASVNVNAESRNEFIGVLQALADGMQWGSYYNLVKKIDICYLQTFKGFREKGDSCYPNLEKLLFHKPEVIKEELDRFSPFKCDFSQKNIGSIIELVRVSLYILQGKKLKDNKNKKLDNKNDVLARISVLSNSLRIKIITRYLHAILQDFDCFQGEGAQIRDSLIKEIKKFILTEEHANDLITYGYEQERKKVIEKFEQLAPEQNSHISCVNKLRV